MVTCRVSPKGRQQSTHVSDYVDDRSGRDDHGGVGEDEGAYAKNEVAETNTATNVSSDKNQ